MRDVLHGADAPYRVFRLEVERPEVDRVIGRAIDAMKSDPDEALLLNVLALDVELDASVRELDPWQVRDAVARASIKTSTFHGPIFEAACVAVEDSQAFTFGKPRQIRLDRLALPDDSGSRGESNHPAKRSDHEAPSVHSLPLVFDGLLLTGAYPFMREARLREDQRR